MRKVIFGLLIIVLGYLVTFVNQAQSDAGPTKMSAKSPVTETGWKQEWAKTLALAKQEGTVSIVSTSWTQDAVATLIKTFKDKYGINVEFTLDARGNEMAVKLQQQQRAGLNFTDLLGGGTNTVFNMLKPAGLVGDLEPLLILPEVKDPKYWLGGRIPFVDKDKTYIAVLAQKQHYIIYNTNLVKKGEITTYKDVLKPQYKGKITMNDPTMTGPGSAMFAHLAHHVWNVDETKEFLRRLLVDQQAVIQRDVRLQVETVAKGKYSIGLGSNMAVIETFLKAETPIDAVITTKEGFYVSPAAGGISAPVKLAHPNAAKVFLNWFLSKEGVTIFSAAMGGVSTRVDVPTDTVRPLWRFNPGDRIFNATEEGSEMERQLTGIVKKVIEETIK